MRGCQSSIGISKITQKSFLSFFFFYLPGWVGNGHLFSTTLHVLGKIITLLQLYPGKSHIILLFYFGEHSLCFMKSMRTWEPSDSFEMPTHIPSTNTIIKSTTLDYTFGN